jgi:Mn2+/Fe2+ NRAMP family transporter
MSDIDHNSCAGQIFGVLSWTMLAASTVGPGSVVVCSKCGADYGLNLLWCLIIACAVAYALLEAAARMVIVSGTSLGQSMITKFGGTVGIPLVCYFASVGVMIGNCFYSANSFAGGMSAAYILHDNNPFFRWFVTLLWTCGALGVLLFGDVDFISSSLGIVVVLMTVTFGVSAAGIDTDATEVLGGLIPNVPTGSATLILATVGTTAIPFNLFLAGNIAKGNTINEMRFGVAVATSVSFVASTFITIVGSGLRVHPTGKEFEIVDLVAVLRRTVGEQAVVCFASGLFCAAVSVAISVPMAAALCAQSLLRLENLPPDSADIVVGARDPSARSRASRAASKAVERMSDYWCVLVMCGKPFIAFIREHAKKAEASVDKWDTKGVAYRFVIIFVLLAGTFTAGFDLPSVPVILVCQVVNGVLLPFLGTILVLCINDHKIMVSSRLISRYDPPPLLQYPPPPPSLSFPPFLLPLRSSRRSGLWLLPLCSVFGLAGCPAADAYPQHHPDLLRELYRIFGRCRHPGQGL